MGIKKRVNSFVERNSIHSPLSSRLMRSVMAIYIFVAIIITSTEFYLQFHSESNKLKSDIADLIDIFNPMLGQALWEYNSDQVQTTSAALLEYDSIVGLQLDNDFEEVETGWVMDEAKKMPLFSEHGKQSENMQEKPYYQKSMFYVPFDIAFIDKDSGEQRKLGQGVVYSSYGFVLDRVSLMFLTIAISAIMKTIFLCATFHFCLTRIAARPLKMLTQGMDKFDMGDTNFLAEEYKPTKRGAETEIDRLWEAFSNMTMQIMDKNKELEVHQDCLTEKIEERTEELNEKNSELEKIVQELEKASESKSIWLANMSHEIRTPINGVMGITQLMMDTQLNDLQAHYIELLYNSGNTLLSVVNDILDISKIEAGKTILESTPFNLKNLISDISAVFSEKVLRGDVELLFMIDNDVELALIGDVLHTKQILINLIGNAFKFTEVGYILVQVSKNSEASVEEGCMIEFKVTDSGIGMTEEQAVKIFESFTQANNSTTRQYGGTGLGLTISKHLAQLLGGDLTVKSQAGIGSVFSCTLTFNVDEKSEVVGEELPEQIKDIKCIAVGFEKGFCSFVDLLKQQYDLNIELVNTQDKMKYIIPNVLMGSQPPEAFLIHAGISESNKVKLFEQLETIFSEARAAYDVNQQQEEAVKDRLLLIICGAESSQYWTACAPSVQMVFVSKPLSSFSILQRISKKHYVSDNNAAEVSDELEEAPDFSDIHVLIVEDNHVNTLVVKGLLRSLNIRSTSVENGSLAVDQVKNHVNERFDLILMDCEMPVMDGYEATRQIRRFEEQEPQKSLIIGLSAYAMKEQVEKALDLGFDDYLTKPIKREAFQAVLKKHQKTIMRFN